MTLSTTELAPGMVVWAEFGPARGREQDGRRPGVVVASTGYLAVADTLAVVVPLTTRNRSWPNHVLAAGPTGLPEPSWAMTEHLRAISRERITSVAGAVSPSTLAEIRLWLSDFLELRPA